MRALNLLTIGVLSLLVAGNWTGPAFAADSPSSPAAVLNPGDNLLLDNVPPIPAEIATQAARYGESRGAAILDVGPGGEILISTRFGDSSQVHLVTQPLGDRTQLTFFPDRVEGAAFEPTHGKYFIFHKGTGGAEFFQNYRFDLFSGEITLLTDGKSRNSMPRFSYDGARIAYTSTRRKKTDTDIYLENPLDPKSDRLLAEVQGGGWEIEDWSTDGKQLLVSENVSINENYLWTIDTTTGAKTSLTPRTAASAETVAYRKACFVRQRAGAFADPKKRYKGVFVLTDQGGEFTRLACLDPDTGNLRPISENLAADVEDFALSEDGLNIAYTTDEDGCSVLRMIELKAPHLLDFHLREGIIGFDSSPFTEAAGPFFPEVIAHYIPQIGSVRGVISGLKWNPFAPDSNQTKPALFFNVANASIASDVYRLQGDDKEPITVHTTARRFTRSETGGLPPYGFVQPQLIKWKSFDGQEISGFLYAPDTKKFPGPRPVIVNIHGGPESQVRPVFLGRNNYLVNELGCALILPNVRGSSGYGKTFLKADNGFKREDSYKDVDALLDWIKTQSGTLDPARIMITGGSYGGHMTLAVSTFYADKIRCSVDVVGMSNLKTFLEHTESYRRDLRRAEYGDERDPKMAEFLEKIAPMNDAAKITKPIFVVQGYNDPRVPRSEAEQIVATLKAQGTPVWFLMARDEGHGFAKKKNADFQFYATVDFIRRYLLDGM